MPLCRLVLLNIVNQHFQAAVYAAVVQIESKAPDLKRLSTALMLPGVDARPDLVEDLIVAREERILEDGLVTAVNGRLDHCVSNHYAGMHFGDRCGRLGYCLLALRVLDYSVLNYSLLNYSGDPENGQ